MIAHLLFSEGVVMRLFLAAATIALASYQAGSGQTPLTLVGTIDLPGVEGAPHPLCCAPGAQGVSGGAPGKHPLRGLEWKGRPPYQEPARISRASRHCGRSRR